MENKEFVERLQRMLQKSEFVERCVSFDGGEAIQVKTTDGAVFNISSRKRESGRSVALVNRRTPRYCRENSEQVENVDNFAERWWIEKEFSDDNPNKDDTSEGEESDD